MCVSRGRRRRHTRWGLALLHSNWHRHEREDRGSNHVFVFPAFVDPNKWKKRPLFRHYFPFVRICKTRKPNK